MRRLKHLVVTVLVVVPVLAVMLVGPAMAAEEPVGEAEAAEPTGFGAGMWDGLILAAVAGLVAGVLVFADSKPGEIGGHDGGHH